MASRKDTTATLTDLPQALADASADKRLDVLRHVAAQAHVAAGGEQACGVLQVFHPQRQAVQRPQRLATQHLRFGFSGGGAGALVVGGADRVHRRVHRFDARDAGFEQFDR